MILLGLGLGIAVNSFNPELLKSWFDWETKEPVLVAPEGGVKSDAWSLSVFQTMAKLQPEGFVFSPLGLNIILQDIQALADDETAEIINEMGLPSLDAAMEQGSPAKGFSQLILDDQVVTKDASRVFSLPLIRSRAQAFSSLSLQLGQAINNSFEYPITNALISREAKFLGFTLILQELKWLHPFRQKPDSYIEFQVGQGRTQMLDALDVQAPIRHVCTDLYDAYALMLKGEEESEKASCMLIIMPKLDELADFIKLLNTQELNKIKEALMQDEALSEMHFKLPAFQSIGMTSSMRPLLGSMGLAHLFSDEAKFPQLTEQSIRLEELWHSANFVVTAEQESWFPKRDAKPCSLMLEINRPFIWMVGDLSHGDCPSLMGSVPSL